MNLDFSRISEQNPWWHNPNAIQNDFHIRSFETSPMKWEPRELNAFRFDLDAVYTLRGPRQVGKTTLLKLLIRRLWLSGWGPDRLCFMTCDLIRDFRELADGISAYIRWARGRTTERLAIFLDEVSFVNQWQRAVKYLWDRGELQGTTLLLTGSHAMDIRRGTELLPGRRGERHDVDHLLLPLDFRGFWNATRPGQPLDIPSLNDNSLSDLARGHIDPLLPFAAWAGSAEPAFYEYLLTGGFPLSIRYLPEGGIPPHVYQTYLHWVRGDFLKLGKAEEYLRALLGRIIEVQSTPVSWQSLASGTGIGSHHTVQDYVETLEASFAVHTLYRYNPSKDRGFLGKNRKIYFTDPFLYHAFNGWLRGTVDIHPVACTALLDSALTGKLAEAAVVEHAARLFPENVYYWRNRVEVDLAIKTPHGLVPVEVKFQGQIGPYDVKALKHMGGGILVSRNTFLLLDGISVLPAPLFLAILSRPFADSRN